MGIGKEKSMCQVVVDDDVISRKHCQIQFDPTKGAFYLMDLSTNGTFLNKTKLPRPRPGKDGKIKENKVRLFHGDELTFHAPKPNEMDEFGFIVNLEVL